MNTLYWAASIAVVLGYFWYSRKSQVSVATAAGVPAPGIVSSTGITILDTLTTAVKWARNFGSWFKSNYWHAFVAGMLAMWLCLSTYSFATHPFSALLGIASAQKMLGLAPTAMSPPILEAAKATVDGVPDEPVKSKKKRKAVVRQDDTSGPFKFF